MIIVVCLINYRRWVVASEKRCHHNRQFFDARHPMTKDTAMAGTMLIRTCSRSLRRKFSSIIPVTYSSLTMR